MADARGYEKWLRCRREKAATDPTDDQVYRDFVDQATGQAATRDAGRVHSGAPGGAVNLSEHEASDDEIYRRYRAELVGSSARLRSEEAAREHQREREQQALRHARLYGRPLPSDLEHLRPRLQNYGY